MKEPTEDQKPQYSGIGCLPIRCNKNNEQPKNTDEEEDRIGNLLPRSFLEGKPEAREVLEKKKRRKNEEKQENRIKRIPNPSFIFEKKPNFTEVFYINIPDTKRGKELLLHDLPIQWTMPEPEAVISITGIDHQFNIKDNCKLKRDLIEAVISTESWIVTCGTESGTVQFIEEAVNAHIAIKNCHIPIVGILPQQVYDEMRNEKKHNEVISIERLKKDNWVEIPCISMQEVLDPIHTQFIFTNNVKRNKNEREATCREAFEHFLLNINIKERDADLETQEILPVILVLIEGGIRALKTAKRVLNQENHVVVINGSGGAADFLVAYYCRTSSMSREGNGHDGEMTRKDITEKIKDYCDDASEMLPKDIEELSKWFMKKDKQEKIHVFSLDNNTNGIDEVIQDAMFEINKECHQKKIDNEKGIKKKNALKNNAVKDQLKLVEKWQRCDIAKKEIFIAKNRIQLTCLQKLNKGRMDELQNEIRQEIDKVEKTFGKMIFRYFPKFYKHFQEAADQFAKYRKQLEEDTSQYNEETQTHYFSVLSTSFKQLVQHIPVDYLKKFKTELKDITNKLDMDNTLYTRSMNALNKLEHQVITVMSGVKEKHDTIIKDLSDSCERFKKDVLRFEEVDKNKAKYFSDLSFSFKDIIDHMTVYTLDKHKYELREIVDDIVDEYKKDMVSQLFLTSITSNRKDLVELTMDRLENIEAFVFEKLANIYWRCIKESPEDLPIKLIEQKLLKQEEKTEDTKQIKRENSEYEVEIEIETQEDIRKRRKSNKILFAIDKYIIHLFGDTKFNLYKKHIQKDDDGKRFKYKGTCMNKTCECKKYDVPFGRECHLGRECQNMIEADN